MKSVHTLTLAVLFVFFVSPLWAIDLRVDTTFRYAAPPFPASSRIYDIFVYPDGKVLAAGRGAQPILVRLNTDGTVDPTFTSPLGPSGSDGYVTNIEPLANGQFLLIGNFTVGGSFSGYARINADGSHDTTLPPGGSGTDYMRTGLPDGKLMACGTRTENSVLYAVARRRNSNGSLDPTFRITWATSGYCEYVSPLPDGKILMSGEFLLNGQPLKPLVRLNADGSLDNTFDAALAAGAFTDRMVVQPDGKILISTQRVKRLNPNGSLDLDFPLCRGNDFILNGDSSYYMTECSKWNGGTEVFDVGRVSTDGAVDATLDRISVSGPIDEFGLEPGLGGDLYIYGEFGCITSDCQARKLVRLTADTRKHKVRFDFDNDGKADLAVYRPSNGTWYLNQSTAGIAYQQWGLANDKPLVGDANRDGKTDIGVFRDGAWHALSSAGHHYMCLGAAGDKPMSIFRDDDWGGGSRDGYLTRGLRSGAVQWFVFDGYGYGNCWLNNQQPSPDSISGELAADRPVTGDFNGDSRGDIGYYRDGVWQTMDPEGWTPPRNFQWGAAGDIPVPGDYDADRQTDYAVFRPSTGVWWINLSSGGNFIIKFGQNGDIPVPADYDGDGKMDIAIYRNGVWWQYRMGGGTVYVEQWGVAGDIPIPAQNQ